MAHFINKLRSEKMARAANKTRETWFSRVKTLFQSSNLADDLWEELEELMIMSDIGVVTTQKLLLSLKKSLTQQNISDPDGAIEVLKTEMIDLLVSSSPPKDQDGRGPLVVLMVGVNGSGKTTSAAKLAHLYKGLGKKVLLGAADTFRAAAIEQLQTWGSRLGVDVIAHTQGADPAAVAFDTFQAARSRGADVAIIDTAGRLHTKSNLMEEIKKVQRVLSRQEKVTQRVLLTLDATTGQNGLYQARAFTEALSCDGGILSKLDGTSKGGIVLAIADELKLPVLYVGTGERLDDIVPFDPRSFVDALFGEQLER